MLKCEGYMSFYSCLTEVQKSKKSEPINVGLKGKARMRLARPRMWQ